MEKTTIKPFWLTEQLVDSNLLKLQRMIDDYAYLESNFEKVKSFDEIDYKPNSQLINKCWDIKEKYFRIKATKMLSYAVYQDMHRRILELKSALEGKTYLQIYQCIVLKDYTESKFYKKFVNEKPEEVLNVFKIHKLIVDSVTESNEKANSAIDMTGLSEIDFANFRNMEMLTVMLANATNRNKVRITLWNKFQKEEFQWINIFIKVNKLRNDFTELIGKINHDREGIPDEPMFKGIRSILEYAHNASQIHMTRAQKPPVIKKEKVFDSVVIDENGDPLVNNKGQVIVDESTHPVEPLESLPPVKTFSGIPINIGSLTDENGKEYKFNNEIPLDIENEDQLMEGKITAKKFAERCKAKEAEFLDKERRKMREEQKKQNGVKIKEFDDMFEDLIS